MKIRYIQGCEGCLRKVMSVFGLIFLFGAEDRGRN